jgi:hypothetical protein
LPIVKIVPTVLLAAFVSTSAFAAGEEEILQQLLSGTTSETSLKNFLHDNQDVLKTILDETAETPARTSSSNADAAKSQAAPAMARTALQTSALEPGGGLQGAHLDGYPALPDVPPTSSILDPTPAQLLHKLQLDRHQAERKRFFIDHPTHLYE